MAVKGLMDPKAFGALGEDVRMDAWLKGDQAALPSDFHGETAEEVVKSIALSGLTGSRALGAFMKKIPGGALGIKIGGIAAANVISDWIAMASPFDAATKSAIRFWGRNGIQAVIAAFVEKSADAVDRVVDQQVQRAEYITVRNPARPEDGAKVVLILNPDGTKTVHPAAIESGAYKLQLDTGSSVVPATTCWHCEALYAAHVATFRRETVQQGGGGRQRPGQPQQGGGTRTTEPPAFRAAELVDFDEAARLANVTWCPDEWPTGKPAAAPKTKTWRDQVGPKGVTLLDAMLLYPHTTADKLDDIMGVDIAKEATNVPVDEWVQLAGDIEAGTGIYAGCWQAARAADPTAVPPVTALEESLTKKGFNLVLDKICARGKGKLEPGNVAKKISVGTIEKAKAAWKENKGAAVAILATAGGLSIGYALSGIVIVWSYYEGLTGTDLELWGGGGALTPFEQSTTLFLASLAGLIWLVPWYSGVIKSFSFGLLGEGLADTARNIAALLCGFASVLIVMKALNGFFTGTMAGTDALVSMPFAGILAVIAYNRIAAKWHAEESVHHLEVWLAENNIRVLSAMGGAVFVLMAVIGWLAWLDTGTTFPVKVAERVVNGTSVQYIPTPNGGAFVPGDILGRATAVTTGPVCRPKGADVDLPGYAEKEVANAACTGGDVGYAVRERTFGRILDDGPVEYVSLEELVLATAKADAALVNAVEASKPKTTVTTSQGPASGSSAIADQNTPCYLLPGGCK